MEQDIIEKKPSSPLLTSLLVIVSICLLSSMVLQGMEIHELTHKQTEAAKSGTAFHNENSKLYRDKVKELGQPLEK